MSTPKQLRDDLRELARKYGAIPLIGALADVVKEYAVVGASARLEERNAESVAAEQCPRCRRNAAVIKATLKTLRPPAEGEGDR